MEILPLIMMAVGEIAFQLSLTNISEAIQNVSEAILIKPPFKSQNMQSLL